MHLIIEARSLTLQDVVQQRQQQQQQQQQQRMMLNNSNLLFGKLFFASNIFPCSQAKQIFLDQPLQKIGKSYRFIFALLDWCFKFFAILFRIDALQPYLQIEDWQQLMEFE